MQPECTQHTFPTRINFPGFIPREMNPYLFWSVHAFQLKGRKSLIVMNKACYSAFLLYGLKEDSRDCTEQLILDGIERLLINYEVGPRFIEQYLTDCQKNLFWTTKIDQRSRSVLQKLLDGINRYTFYLTSSTPYQDSFTDWAALQNFGGTNPETALTTWIGEYYKDRAIPCRDMAQILISLKSTGCIRTLRVPFDLSLYDFHQVIQKSFSWQNYHLHCFYAQDLPALDEIFSRYNTPVRDPDYEESLLEVEKSLTVRDLFQKTAKAFYLYDYGEEWIHVLTLLDVEEYSPRPVCSCILASEDAPPEDVSGVGGYPLFQEVIGNLIHPAHIHFLVWSVNHGWSPLDLARINEKLFAY